MALANAARDQWSSSQANASGTSIISNLLQSGRADRLNFWSHELTDLESGQNENDREEEDDGAATVSMWKFWEKQTTPEDPSLVPSMGWNQRFKLFVVCMLCAAVFFSLSVVFLSMIVIRPSKFALSFTLGSLSFMVAFAMLKGPKAYLTGLMERKNMVFSLVYVVSLLLTLYSCLVLGSYMMVILSSTFQICALGWYGASALPGGNRGIKAFVKLFQRTSKMVVRSCIRLLSS